MQAPEQLSEETVDYQAVPNMVRSCFPTLFPRPLPPKYGDPQVQAARDRLSALAPQLWVMLSRMVESHRRFVPEPWANLELLHEAEDLLREARSL